MKIIPQYNRDILIKYDKVLPRYTSYPTALQFSDDFGLDDWRKSWSTTDKHTELSLYFHIPFCRSPCFYCACNRIITRDTSRSLPYLDAIFDELAIVSSQLNSQQKRVSQIHLGGGTPTFLSIEQLTDLWGKIDQYFTLDTDGEYSIEIDPRAASVAMIKQLAKLGFKRMSFGVQDLDKSVQQAINRVQSTTQTFAQIDAARLAGVESINVDLIYGLPRQTVETFSTTIDRVLESRPERVAVYAYAHMPAIFKAQRQIAKYELPDLSDKLKLLEIAIDKFQAAGYDFIGLDHFALPTDELAIARRNGSLHRNFQGYSTKKDLNMLGFGVTSIGKIGDTYYQNNKLENDYIALVNSGEVPLAKGYSANTDDKIRNQVIMDLMCQGAVDYSAFNQSTGLKFTEYFQTSLNELYQFEQDGLIQLDTNGLYVTPIGQLLLRNIANTFDAYRKPKQLNQIPIKLA